MCVMPAHFHFIALILWNIQNKTENQKMKKCFSTLLVLAMAMTLWSCSDDEGGKIPENVTRSIKVINHIVDTKADAVMPLNESVIDYKLNRTNMTIDLTIRAKWDGEHESTVTLSGIQTTEHNGVCSFKASGSGIENLKGHIDFNEATMRINYTAEGKYRVICTTPEIYSTQCATSVLYTDGQSWQSNATMYQFNINVAEGTAAINVMDLMDQAKRRTLTTVKSKTPAKVTATKEELSTTERQLSEVKKRITETADLIPQITHALELYPYLHTAREKNDLLKTVITKIVYEKSHKNPIGTRHGGFTINVFLKYDRRQ